MRAVKQIAADRRVKKVIRSLESELQDTIDLAIRIQQIPAPTFNEEKRAAYVEVLFEQMGLADVKRDDLHNVYGRLRGKESETPLVVSAHLDSVFPADTDLSVKFEDTETGAGRIFGPGLADNALGVAGVATLARALTGSKIQTLSDIWFVANVGEEGLGNLRGMRAVVERFGPNSTYVVIEGGSFGHVFHEAVGVGRYSIQVDTPGGHAWGDFGSPSAVHILGQIIAHISSLNVPELPKTTFNVGVVEGGTTINAIASSARCQVDTRSLDGRLLDELAEKIRKITAAVGAQEEVSVKVTKIGERPSGRLPKDLPVIQAAADALRFVGCQPVEYMAGSTDASVPISMGIPSVCIGLARSGNTHRLDEFVDTTQLGRGMGQLFLLTLALAGYQGSH